MKPLGTLTEDQRLAFAELEGLEAWCENEKDLTKEQKAKHMTALAHDWLAMDYEERAIHLFIKANKFYPDYFRTIFIDHCRETPKFALIAGRIAGILIDMEVGSSGISH